MSLADRESVSWELGKKLSRAWENLNSIEIRILRTHLCSAEGVWSDQQGRPGTENKNMLSTHLSSQLFGMKLHSIARPCTLLTLGKHIKTVSLLLASPCSNRKGAQLTTLRQLPYQTAVAAGVTKVARLVRGPQGAVIDIVFCIFRDVQLRERGGHRLARPEQEVA